MHSLIGRVIYATAVLLVVGLLVYLTLEVGAPVLRMFGPR